MKTTDPEKQRIRKELARQIRWSRSKKRFALRSGWLDLANRHEGEILAYRYAGRVIEK